MKKSSRRHGGDTDAGGGSAAASWLLTRDHRKIAVLYLGAVTFFFLAGGLLASLMRAEAATPRTSLFSDTVYNGLFSLHGILMIFFFMIPAIPSVLGNLQVPGSLGGRNLAFPRLNLVGWYLFVGGGLLVLLAALRGGADTTWTFLEPLIGAHEGGPVGLLLVGILAASTAVTLLSINFLTSIHMVRDRQIGWGDLPIFTWTIYGSSLITMIATPLLLALIVLLLVERGLGTAFFDPAAGGDPAVFRRLFWLYARPMFYAMILPAVGLITQILTGSRGGLRRRGYRLALYSVLSIVPLGFLTAGVHLIPSDSSALTALISTFMGFLSALPFVLLFGYWLTLLMREPVAASPPVLFVLGALLLVVIGGLTGLILTAAGGNIHLHSTLFVVAHFHYFLAGGVVMAYLGGLHQGWSALSGRSYSTRWATLSPVLLFVGLNLTFFPLLLLGFQGMPRRFHAFPPEFELFQLLSSAGLTILFLGYLLPMFYLTCSLRFGKASCRETAFPEPVR